MKHISPKFTFVKKKSKLDSRSSDSNMPGPHATAARTPTAARRPHHTGVSDLTATAAGAMVGDEATAGHGHSPTGDIRRRHLSTTSKGRAARERQAVEPVPAAGDGRSSSRRRNNKPKNRPK